MSADLTAILARLDALEGRRTLVIPADRVDEIKLRVSEAFGVPVEEMEGRSREDGIVRARHAAMHLIRKKGRSWTTTGGAFFRTHGAAIMACRSFSARMQAEPVTRALVEGVESSL